MQKYVFLKLIGEGSYGKVFRAVNTETKEIVAVKRTRTELLGDGLPPTTIREVSLLWALSEDKHIVKLLAVEHVRVWRGDRIPVEPEPEDEKHGEKASEDPNVSEKPRTPVPPPKPIPLVYLIFEHLDFDLKDFMDDYRKQGLKLPSRLVKEFMFQLLTGVCFCHSRGILHRDLKPQNILVDKKHGFLKLADFGLGREFAIPAKQYTSEVVTVWYRAPELLLGTPDYSTPVDIWSLGCVFAELARMSPIFHAVSDFEQLLMIFKVLGTPSEAEWQGVTSFNKWNEFPQWKKKDVRIYVPELENDGVDLLSKMLVYNPSDRISAMSALAHPYFSDLDGKFLKTHRLL